MLQTHPELQILRDLQAQGRGKFIESRDEALKMVATGGKTGNGAGRQAGRRGAGSGGGEGLCRGDKKGRWEAVKEVIIAGDKKKGS